MKGQIACFSAADTRFATVSDAGTEIVRSTRFKGLWRRAGSLAQNLKAAGVEASLVTASAQLPERTEVREESEHCRGAEWQVSQALSTEFIQAA